MQRGVVPGPLRKRAVTVISVVFAVATRVDQGRVSCWYRSDALPLGA